MGDVLDTDTLWDGLYRTKYKRKYVLPKKYYVSIVKQLKQMHVTDIVITAATYHIEMKNFKKRIKRHELYLSNVESFLKQHGFGVQRRINCGTPDEDFIFMSNANIFVQGGGTYSAWISKMVKMNGGTVIYNETFFKEMKLVFDGSKYYILNQTFL